MVAAIAAAGVLLAVVAGLATSVRGQPARGPVVPGLVSPGLVPGDPVARRRSSGSEEPDFPMSLMSQSLLCRQGWNRARR